MKRTNCTTAAPAGKKTKVVDPAVKSLEKIAISLREASQLPPAIAGIFCDTLSDFLLPLPGGRHAYQQKMVEMLAAELAKIEVVMQTAIETAKEVVTRGEEEKATRADVATQADSRLQAERQVCNEQKIALADATVVFNTASDASSYATSQEENGRCEVQGATAKKLAVQTLSDSLMTLHKEPAKIASAIKLIVQHVKIEEAMLAAVPSALEKEASLRQGFDQMVMQQLQEKVSTRIAELTNTIDNSGPTLEALAKTSQTASVARVEARDKMIERANTFTTAQTEQTDAETALKTAQKDLKDTCRQLGANKRALDESMAQLDLFQDGALASFRELRERAPAHVESAQDQGEKMVDGEPACLVSEQVLGIAGA